MLQGMEHAFGLREAPRLCRFRFVEELSITTTGIVQYRWKWVLSVWQEGPGAHLAIDLGVLE